MKKIILLAFGGFFTLMVNSQSVEKSKLNPNLLQDLDSPDAVSIIGANGNSSFSYSAEDAGDTIWIEDFASGIPTGWTLSGANSSSCPWKYSFVGSSGYYNGGNFPASAPAMNSTSAANGFLLCDPDSANHSLYGQPSGSTYQYLESYITTAPINLTGEPSVRLEFEHSFRYNNSPDLEVSVSTDGVTWTTFEAKGDVLANSASDDPTTYSQDVSAEVGGSATAYIRIGWSARVYYWMVDDIRLTVPPANDLVLTGTFYRNQIDTGFSQYYSMIPIGLADLDTIQFSGNVLNSGSSIQTNTTFTNSISTPTGSNVMSAGPVDIAPTVTDSMIITNTFVLDQGLGQYEWVFSTASDSVDNVPDDNVMDTVDIAVTDSTYARDRDAIGNRWYGAGQYYEIGPLFDIYDTVKATSISVGLGTSTPAGSIISVRLYDGSLTTPIVSREFITLSAADVGGNLATFSIPETILEPGQYIVTYATFSDTVTFPVSPQGADPQTVFVDPDQSGTWFYTTSIPIVRLNVSSDLFVCDLGASAIQTGNNTAEVTASLGTSPYSYEWDNGETTMTATNLTSGTPFGPGLTHTVTVTDANGCTAGASVDIVNSVGDLSLNSNVTLFPNPNTGNFQMSMTDVTAGNYEVTVKNYLGQTIYSDAVEVNGAYTGTINLSNVSKGVYFLELSNENEEKSVIRFVVK